MYKLSNYLIYLFIVSSFLITSCSNFTKQTKNIDEPQDIKILSDFPGIGAEISNHYKITAHYIGSLEDGTIFDDSYKRNIPIKFQVGLRQIIPGWELGIVGMKKGGRRKIKIPPSLGYGKKGVVNKIPSNATLIFDIEIINIESPSYKIIEPTELLIQKDNFVIVDIRSTKEQLDTGIIDGSYKITAFNERGNLKSNFLKNYKSIIKNNDPVVLISDKGEVSTILANGLIENLGMKNIFSLKGGIRKWIDLGNKIIK